MNKKTVVPVIHEFGAYLLVPSLDLYYAVINYYENNGSVEILDIRTLIQFEKIMECVT